MAGRPNTSMVVALAIPAVLAVGALAMPFAWTQVQPHLDLEPGSVTAILGSHIAVILAVAAMTELAIRVMLFLIARHLGSPPPRLMRHIIALLTWGLAAAILAAVIFGVPLGSLVTTSGLLVAVIGIALKNMISDLFTGLSLPVKMGHWIEVDGVLGEVVEVGWRATRLVTMDNVTLIVPNTHLMAKPFCNYSQPEPYYRDKFRITLPHEVTAFQAERNLLAAVRQVAEIAALPKLPEVRVAGINEHGIEWELRYYVPGVETASGVRYKVQRNLLRNLHYSGITLPTSTIQLHPAPPAGDAHPLAEEIAFLRGVDLFISLNDAEVEELAAATTPCLRPVGRPVVIQGEAGDSLFVLKEGLLSVSITGDSGTSSVVGMIAPGQFFGEMSLLTGETRSATVVPSVDSMVYEISVDTLAPLLKARPELVRIMSETVAARQFTNRLKPDGALPAGDAGKGSLARYLIGRINGFFGLTAEAAG